MARLCFTKETADKFLTALRDGVIDPNKMAISTSEENIKLLSDIVGKDNAEAANILFEKKLLLKNQEEGMMNWVKSLTDQTPEQKKALVLGISKTEKLLGTPEGELIKRSLAEQKLGIGLSEEQFASISEMSKNAVDYRTKITEDMPDRSPERLQYGAAKVVLTNYVDNIKLSALKKGISEYKSLKGVGKGALQGIEELSGLAKSLQASLDDSAVLRQGWRTLFTNPTEWLKNAKASFSDITRTLKGEDVVSAIKADIYSRKNALNGMYDDMDLAVGIHEEAYPTSLPEKVPVAGRVFRASETAYEGFLTKMRADIADTTINIAKQTGVDLTSKVEMKSIGEMINSLTGRGSLGKAEVIGKHINSVLFSPKLFKSHIDVLTHPLGFDIAGTKITKFTQKRAAVNLAKFVTGTAVVLEIANVVSPGSVEWDPRSSDFGKIKVGNTRFDVTGGMSSVVTLAARLLPTYSKDGEGHIFGIKGMGQYSKSSTSKKLSLLNSPDFGSTSTEKLLTDFAANKLAPMARLVYNLSRQKDFDGNPVTLGGETLNLLTPLPVKTYSELKNDPNSANLLVALMADMMGISTNTYGSNKKKLQTFLGADNVDPKIVAEVDRLSKTGNTPAINTIENSDYSKRMKDQLSPDQYKKFISDFQSAYTTKITQRIDSPFYKKLPAEKKKDQLEKDKSDTLNQMLAKYKYKKPPKIVNPQL